MKEVITMISSSRLTGFRNLEIDARHELLAQTTGLDSTALDVLRPEQGLTLEQAAHMVENAVGVLGIPLGIALNFTINGRDFLFFFFNDTATTEIYTLSLHDALPI